jgi:hypothetical protein
MEILNDSASILHSAEQTLVKASQAALQQKEPVVRTVRDLISAERLNEIGVKLARTADEIQEETLTLIDFEDRDRGRAFDIKI